MKKFNQKLKPFIAGSLVAVTLLSAPFAFANDNNSGKNKNYGYEVKAEQHAKADINNKNSGSFWSKIFGKSWFGARADAQTNASLTPSISGIKAPTVLKTGQMGTWTVKASDPKNGSLEYAVDWGDTMTIMSLMGLKAESAFVQTSTFTHTYAKPGKYTVKFTIKNEAGLSTSSTATVHVSGKPMQEAPIIRDLSATSNRPRQATIIWNTDVRADSHVWYSKLSPVNKETATHLMRPAKILKHKINLTQLEPDTKYYVIVGSKNAGGMTMSVETSFTTKALVDKEAPVITSLEGPAKVEIGEKATVTVNAYDPKNSSLSYSADWGDNLILTRNALMAQEQPIFVQSTTFTHIYAEEGTYTATFTAENDAGKKVSSSINITVTAATPDTIKPVIALHENITLQATSSAGVVVTYTSPTVTDDTDADTTATCSPASGSTFPIGTTTVLCNHTDVAGNIAIQTSFIITVTPEL